MRVLLITGFALDKRAFIRLDLPPEFETFDLIPARRGESLRDYALRMAAEIGLRPGDIIGGVSLGGMLALEMARAIDVRGALIIASATHPRHIRKRFLWLWPIAPLMPDFIISRIFRLIPAVLALQKMLEPPDQALLADIMGHFPPALLRAMPPKIARWPGCRPPARFRHLHSTGDWLIRPAGDPQYLTLLKGGNHLITISHPREVREWLLRTVREFAAG
ncbi:MAG: alpha/beta fold hydrolase [Fibrobacteres bacterium]|nr:alpha/beta fold hydrolase [Fibrobacterota bacterium]